MINTFLGYFSDDLAIDLGTTNTLIYVKGKGIVVREPTVLARIKKTREIVAVGTTAKKMLGRTGKNIEVVRPLKNGVIADMEGAIGILGFLIRKVHAHSKVASHFPRPKVVIGVPGNVTEVQKDAVSKVVLEAGARNVVIVDEALAAALGHGGKSENTPVGIIDIGGGTTDLALISQERIAFERSISFAGDAMDEAIINLLRLKYSLLIGAVSAEELKIQLATAVLEKERFAVCRGRGLESGLPKGVKVSSLDIFEAISGVLKKISAEMRILIEEAPPEFLGDIEKEGILLAGGGALIHGIGEYFQKSIGVTMRVAPDPLSAVVRGCARLL